MPNYSQSKIYKLVSSHMPDTCYVGSTTQKWLSSRKSGHKQKYKKYLKGKNAFITNFDIIRYDDAEIILLEECPCETIDQLKAIERKYIESMVCVNKCIPGRTKKEYYEVNKQKYIDKAKKWEANNPEKAKLCKQKWRLENKETISKKSKEIVVCEHCNVSISKACLVKHQKRTRCLAVQQAKKISTE